MNTRKLNTSQPQQNPAAKTLDIARGLIEGADFLCGKRYYRGAAYLLHQAARSLLSLLVQPAVTPGQQPQTLPDLFASAAASNPQLIEVFASKRPAGQRLFKLLCNAHTQALYDDEYRISARQVEALIYRLALLADLAQAASTKPAAKNLYLV